ncbi:unnamed protein product, partial [Effrenium voratum]
MLRTYFWSLPRVAPTDGSRTRSGSKRLRFSVAVTNEMFLPLPLAFDLALGLSTDGAEFRRLDGQVTLREVCDGLEAEVECGVEDEDLEGRVLVVAHLRQSDSASAKSGKSRSRSPKIRERHYTLDPTPVERLGESRLESLQFSCLSCMSMLKTEEEEYSFRRFQLGNYLLSIREEISSADMPTGGRLWDAGIVLAHWLASGKASSLAGGSVIELGSGCGLPGIVAAHILGGPIVFSDKEVVLPLTKRNVHANCPHLQTFVLEVDWGIDEHIRRALQPIKTHSFDVVLMSDLFYHPSALSKLRDTVLGLTKPGSVLFIAHMPREDGWSGPENPLAELLPWFDGCLLRTCDLNGAQVHLFMMTRPKNPAALNKDCLVA